MGGMPRVSAFYGIVIALYYNDHLPPHFHALYGQYEALVRIDTLETLAGSLPKRARAITRCRVVPAAQAGATGGLGARSAERAAWYHRAAEVSRRHRD